MRYPHKYFTKTSKKKDLDEIGLDGFVFFLSKPKYMFVHSFSKTIIVICGYSFDYHQDDRKKLQSLAIRGSY